VQQVTAALTRNPRDVAYAKGRCPTCGTACTVIPCCCARGRSVSHDSCGSRRLASSAVIPIERAGGSATAACARANNASLSITCRTFMGAARTRGEPQPSPWRIEHRRAWGNGANS